MKACWLAFALSAFSLFVACGGSGGSSTTTPPPPVTYSIGGTVSGLSGSGLVLQDNGGNNLPVSTNGSFTFSTQLNGGSSYNVTVLTEPTTPAQTCAVSRGSGTANSNISSVQVSCANNPIHNVWIWMGGSNTANQAGTYGTEGTAASGNIPGGRDSAVSWTDSTGNLWLFGGFGDNGTFNDLWKYNSGQWTWMSGANTLSQLPVYGTQGIASAANVPGARYAGMSWIDSAGTLWLFGGDGFDAAGSSGSLNDLWSYSAGEWTWVAGSDSRDQAGIYGTKGIAAPGNAPGARHRATTWTDASGNFWLFGGVGYDVNGNHSPLNDLWEYSGGQWTWISGGATIAEPGNYGTQGVASASNAPGARSSGIGWVDSAGNLWLFGGGGMDSQGTLGYLNDLWEYTGGQWIWIGGSNLANESATYGTEGTPSSSNIPAGRIQAVGSSDPSGNFWLFGGYGLDSTATTGYLNDLWKFSPSTEQWTWVSGSSTAGEGGNFGTIGIAAASNVAGARQASASWVDANGNIWLFAGFGADSQGTIGELNDLWEYLP